MTSSKTVVSIAPLAKMFHWLIPKAQIFKKIGKISFSTFLIFFGSIGFMGKDIRSEIWENRSALSKATDDTFSINKSLYGAGVLPATPSCRQGSIIIGMLKELLKRMRSSDYNKIEVYPKL